jgi:hypothetical protein
MIATDHITDLQRLGFVQALLNSELMPDEWETRFLASFRSSSRPSLWFTAGRRVSTDKMWMKYSVLLNHPFPTDDVRLSSRPAPPALPPAEAGGCMYFVKDENRQMQRCNLTATKENRAGFLYCEEHAALALKAVKQKGGEMALRIYNPQMDANSHK